MIKEITNYIATECSLTIDTQIFCGHRPSNAPDECDVVLISAGGALVYGVPGRSNPNVQVISRANSHPGAERRAYRIYNVLNRIYGGVPLASVDGLETALFANVIEPINPPQSIGVDDKGRHEYSTNYIFRLSNQGA